MHRNVAPQVTDPFTVCEVAVEGIEQPSQLFLLSAKINRSQQRLQGAVRPIERCGRGPTRRRQGAIVKTCGSRSLGSFGLGFLTGPLDEFAVDEGGSGADQGDQVWCVDGAPAVLG